MAGRPLPFSSALRGHLPWRQVRSLRLRAVDSLAAFVALFAVRTLWATAYWMTTTGLNVRALMRTLYSRPDPSFFPQGRQGWIDVAFHWRTLLRRLSEGFVGEVGPGLPESPSLRRWTFTLGVVLVLLLLTAYVASAWWSARRGQ